MAGNEIEEPCSPVGLLAGFSVVLEFVHRFGVVWNTDWQSEEHDLTGLFTR
jgi:hypothetical protein